jgi:O-acetyl-ADP-ribose deacetylase (regulator of RNase III)
MLIYRRTSLLESSAQTLVNTVNCVGVMGKGIARAFKEREPQMFGAYKRICDEKLLEPGKLWLWKGSDQWVLNFPTKIHWRYPSKIEWVEAGLVKFASNYSRLGIQEISFPRLGCGNGGLDWHNVRPLMERYLAESPIHVYIHDYTVDIGLPEHMEAVAGALRGNRANIETFDSFFELLGQAAELADSKLFDLETHEHLEARVEDGELHLLQGSQRWAFDADDLWGVWISLQKGLLTQEKAGWSEREGGRPLLSLMSLLPHVRPVQIQKFNRSPELALELNPSTRSGHSVPSQAEPIALQ